MNERAAVTAIVPAFDREDTVGATVTALRSLAPVGEIFVSSSLPDARLTTSTIGALKSASVNLSGSSSSGAGASASCSFFCSSSLRRFGRVFSSSGGSSRLFMRRTQFLASLSSSSADFSISDTTSLRVAPTLRILLQLSSSLMSRKPSGCEEIFSWVFTIRLRSSRTQLRA